jgi:regulator of replication initiation timing
MDVENTQIVRGFPTLARKIAAGPDYETFIFRKFDQLSARNLLHLESRLTYFEWKLTILDEKAALNSETENFRSVLTWEAFENKAREKGSPEYQRMEIAEEISRVLKDYRKLNHIAIYDLEELIESIAGRRGPAAPEPGHCTRGTQTAGSQRCTQPNVQQCVRYSWK